jgi:lipopolysaccharide transport system ATP-binding protein
MNEISVTVQHLSKRYNLGQTNPIKSAAIRVKRSLFETFKQQSNVSSHNSSESGHIWALKDVSFDVRQGEVLGIIGRNGSGKSTLLKILTRITKPSNGFASLRGHASSLLEVGTGFHPELTGRENVYLNGAILWC